MDIDDPFFNSDDSDRTVIRPSPGGRNTQAEGATPSDRMPPPSSSSEQNYRPINIIGSHANSIINAATPILAVIGQLRQTMTHRDVEGLRTHLMQEMNEFEKNSRSLGVSSEPLFAARYALCTLVDEVVLGTPWGSDSLWSKQSLLSTFHNETSGGEKFFQILDRLLKDPARNLELLEFMDFCLALGFEGKYKLMDRGHSKLDELRDNIFSTIRIQRGDYERDLSPHWEGVKDQRNLLVRYVPLWVVAVLAGALLLTVYLGFTYVLNQSSGPLLEQLQSIGQAVPDKN